MKTIKMSLMAALATVAASSGLQAEMLEEIISNPKLSIELRPRYEYVDVDGMSEEASALTVRTSIGVEMGIFGVEGLNAQIQGMDVSNFGWINDYAPETSGYPVVADPVQSRITQANISYAADNFIGIAGRKMVVLDNARFIGNVGWRQMPQTYDLVAGIYNIDNLSLLGAYVTQVNRIFATEGDGPKNNKLSTGSVLLHATYKAMPELTLTAYDYMVENYADHIGLRATGKVAMDEMVLKYETEYAVQGDPSLDEKDDPLYAENRKQDASYYKISADLSTNGFTVGAGYEFLSDKGDGDFAFWTPLATLHAMNGWADVFLGTPAEGLVDTSIKVAYNGGEYGKIVGIYHSFSSDSKNASGDDDLGSEIDIAYKYKMAKGLGLLLKGAWYTAGDDSFEKVDTTKYWVQLDYKFQASY